jgi:hypothetical protein
VCGVSYATGGSADGDGREPVLLTTGLNGLTVEKMGVELQPNPIGLLMDSPEITIK